MLHGFVVNFIVSLQLMTYLVLTILFDCTTCGLLFVFVIFESLSIIPYFLRRFLAFVACCSCFQQLIPYTCPLYCCFGFVLLSIYVCFSDKKSQLVIQGKVNLNSGFQGSRYLDKFTLFGLWPMVHWISWFPVHSFGLMNNCETLLSLLRDIKDYQCILVVSTVEIKKT